MAPRPTADLRRPGLLLATALVLGAGCAAGGDEPSPAPSTSTEASTTSRPSPEAERRSVLIMGDSVLAEAAAPLIHALEATGAAEARFALGPVLPRSESDEVVWQAALDDTDPEVIVVSVGHWEYLQGAGAHPEAHARCRLDRLLARHPLGRGGRLRRRLPGLTLLVRSLRP